MRSMNVKVWCAAWLAAGVGLSSLALADGATIKGKVNWEGKPFKAKRMTGMNPECTGFHAGQPPRYENVVTNDNGTLKYVFVHVTNPPDGDFPVPTEPVVLDQVGCMYQPHVFGVRVGQAVEIRNSDPTAHNVHFLPKKNDEFNKSQPKQGLKDTLTFRRSEIMVPVKCDVHPWMNAFAGVTEHPFFAVTGDDGTFELAGLPPGKYTVQAWHEKYGTQEIVVDVSTGETKDAAFTYSRSTGSSGGSDDE